MSRVAGNVAAMLERELQLGPAIAVEHRRLLAALGAGSDRELAGAIRAGRLDDRIDEVVELVRGDVIERLGLWNPRHVEFEDRGRIARPPGEERFAPDQTRTGDR